MTGPARLTGVIGVALSAPAERSLREFADGYPAYLTSWQDAISAWLRR